MNRRPGLLKLLLETSVLPGSRKAHTAIQRLHQYSNGRLHVNICASHGGQGLCMTCGSVFLVRLVFRLHKLTTISSFSANLLTVKRA